MIKEIKNDEHLKVCTKCCKALPLSDYHDLPKGRHGKHAHCKLCHNEVAKLSNANARHRARNFYLKNREKIKAKYQENKEKIKAERLAKKQALKNK